MGLRYFLKALVLPPVFNILLVLGALWFLGRWPRVRNAVITFGAISLLLLSMPVTSVWLAKWVEVYPALDMAQTDFSDRQAIVVLGGGRLSAAPEYGGADVPKGQVLERLRYGARLHEQTQLPVLLTGGKWQGEQLSEAEVMAESLTRDFKVQALWL